MNMTKRGSEAVSKRTQALYDAIRRAENLAYWYGLHGDMDKAARCDARAGALHSAWLRAGRML